MQIWNLSAPVFQFERTLFNRRIQARNPPLHHPTPAALSLSNPRLRKALQNFCREPPQKCGGNKLAALQKNPASKEAGHPPQNPVRRTGREPPQNFSSRNILAPPQILPKASSPKKIPHPHVWHQCLPWRKQKSPAKCGAVFRKTRAIRSPLRPPSRWRYAARLRRCTPS